MSLAARYARALATIASQRRELAHLHRTITAQHHELATLRTYAGVEADTLRAILAAHPDEARRMALAYHDRCDQLQRANEARESPKWKPRKNLQEAS